MASRTPVIGTMRWFHYFALQAAPFLAGTTGTSFLEGIGRENIKNAESQHA
jgi:hypothetical protein